MIKIFCESCGKHLSNETATHHGKNKTCCCGDNKCKSLIDLNDKADGESYYQFLKCCQCEKVYGIANENCWTDEGFCSIECAMAYESESEYDYEADGIDDYNEDSNHDYEDEDYDEDDD